MQSRKWMLLAGLFTLQSTASNAQEAIGKATSVRPQTEGTHAGNSRVLSGGADVYSNEQIRTGNTGRADLQFQDSTKLTMGPNSSVQLDKSVDDPNKSAGAVAIEAARGSFQFVTGSQGRRARQIKTPYGTLGLRGGGS